MTALGIVIVAVVVGLGLAVAVPMIMSSLRAQRATTTGDGGAAGTPVWGGEGGADCGADGGGGCD